MQLQLSNPKVGSLGFCFYFTALVRICYIFQHLPFEAIQRDLCNNFGFAGLYWIIYNHIEILLIIIIFFSRWLYWRLNFTRLLPIISDRSISVQTDLLNFGISNLFFIFPNYCFKLSWSVNYWIVLDLLWFYSQWSEMFERFLVYFCPSKKYFLNLCTNVLKWLLVKVNICVVVN